MLRWVVGSIGFAVSGLTFVVVVAVLALALRRRAAPSPAQAPQAARRHAGLVNAAAWVVLLGGLVTAATVTVSAPTLASGIVYALISAVAGLMFVAIHGVGELTWPRPSGTLRRAVLARRTTADVAPRWLRRVLWTWGALLATSLLACGVVSDNGQRIWRALREGAIGAGPVPGWSFVIPLLVAVAVVIAAGEAVLHLIAGRPAVMDAAPQWDEQLRRLSAHRVLCGTQFVLGLTTAGVFLVAADALRGLGTRTSTDTVAMDNPAQLAVNIGFLVLAAALFLVSVAFLATALAIALVPGTPAHVTEVAPLLTVRPTAGPDDGLTGDLAQADA